MSRLPPSADGTDATWQTKKRFVAMRAFFLFVNTATAFYLRKALLGTIHYIL
jgi:hypothetical protein